MVWSVLIQNVSPSVTHRSKGKQCIYVLTFPLTHFHTGLHFFDSVLSALSSAPCNRLHRKDWMKESCTDDYILFYSKTILFFSFLRWFYSFLFYSRLCPSTAGSNPPPELSSFLCPLPTLSIALPVAPQCHLSNDVLGPPNWSYTLYLLLCASNIHLLFFIRVLCPAHFHVILVMYWTMSCTDDSIRKLHYLQNGIWCFCHKDKNIHITFQNNAEVW